MLYGEGNGNALQHPCLENPMDRGAWQVTSHAVTESDTTSGLAHTVLCELGFPGGASDKEPAC